MTGEETEHDLPKERGEIALFELHKHRITTIFYRQTNNEDGFVIVVTYNDANL